jgi:hypothetical protein
VENNRIKSPKGTPSLVAEGEALLYPFGAGPKDSWLQLRNILLVDGISFQLGIVGIVQS